MAQYNFQYKMVKTKHANPAATSRHNVDMGELNESEQTPETQTERILTAIGDITKNRTRQR